MKKIVFLLIVITLIFTLTGCSKKSNEPYFTLIYNGRTYMTTLAGYNNNKNSYEAKDMQTNYIKIKQNEKLQYSSHPSADKVILVIRSADNKKKIEEVRLHNDYVDTSISQGKYIYTFNAVWKNGSSEFETLIEIN